MSWKIDKWKEEWPNFKAAWWETRKGFKHDYVDFFVELNRHMPYTKGHIEAISVPIILVGFLVWAVYNGCTP